MGYWMERAKQLKGETGHDSSSLAENQEQAPDILPSQPSDAPAIPESPLQPGWLVVYRDRGGKLCGGCDDREHGTVQECLWAPTGWTVHLTDGQRLPLSMIRSVGKTDDAGIMVSAWTVREHGYDGEGPL